MTTSILISLLFSDSNHDRTINLKKLKMLEKNENLGRKSLYEKSYELKIKSMKP
jgi:hypothetical protein